MSKALTLTWSYIPKSHAPQKKITKLNDASWAHGTNPTQQKTFSFFVKSKFFKHQGEKAEKRNKTDRKKVLRIRKKGEDAYLRLCM